MSRVDRWISGSGSIDASFGLDAPVPFVLVQVQAHFRRESGAAASYLAPLLIRRFAAAGRRFDNELWRLESAGVAADDGPHDVNLRIAGDEQTFYRLAAGDSVKIAWSDPSAGAVAWGVIVTLDEQED
jgi:hypothetical protein